MSSAAGAKTLTASVGDCTNREYDKTATVSCTINLATKESGDTVTATGTCTIPSATVGDNKTVTCSNITLGGADSAKYTLSSTTATKENAVNITKKTLTASIGTCTDKTYDGTDTVTCTINVGIVESGDTVTASGTCKASNANAGTNKTVECTGITLSGSTSGQYKLYATTATKTNAVTIAQKVLTSTQITAYSTEWASGATTYSRTVSTGVGSETVTLTYTPYSNAARTYTFATSAASGKFTLSQSNSNYAISGAGDFTIEPKEIQGSVSISGTTTWGDTLTANPSCTDPSSGCSFTYQWKANGSNITGATSSTYVIGKEQVGKTITVSVVASASNYANKTLTSDATAAVGKQDLSAALSVGSYSTTYDGTAKSLSLTVTSAEWNGKTIVSGATTSYGTTVTNNGEKDVAYTLSPSYTNFTDGYKSVYYKVTGGDYYNDKTGSGSIRVKQKSIRPTAYSTTWISGATTYSRTVSTGVGSETITLTYTPYSNAVGSYAYATIAASGKFTLSQSNTNYSISSADDLTLTGAAITGSVSISGTATWGNTLTANPSCTTPSSGCTFTYQWYSNTNNSNSGGSAISGATSSTYQIPSTLIGKYIYVVATASATNYTDKPLTSTQTSAVAKKASTISLNPTSGTLTYGTNGTSAITKTGDGTLSCASSNTSVATCSISGTTLTITPVANTSDNKTATITVTIGEGDTYLANTTGATYSVTVNRQTLTCPDSPADKTYNGSEQASGITCPTGSTSGGNTAETHASNSYAQTCTASAGYKFASTCSVSWKIKKYTPTITISPSSGAVSVNAQKTFVAKANSINACLGTLTVVSEDATKASITQGASTTITSSNVNTDISIKYKGEGYSAGTKLNVNFAPTNTDDCDNADQKQYNAFVNRITQYVSLDPKTGMVYNGSSQAANTATTTGNGTISYKYYTDSSCSTGETSTAPTNAGNYYVKASATQTDQYNAASSECIAHTINTYQPVINLTAKSATYTGNPITANTPTVTLTNNETYNGTINIAYYNGTSCSGSALSGAPTEVGNYSVKATTAAFTNYKAAEKCVTHTITSHGTSLNLSSPSGTLTYGTPGTITITTDGDGAITCESSDITVATCSVSGNTLTITPVANNTDGKTATITVNQAAGTNYGAASAEYAVTVNRKTLSCPDSPADKTYNGNTQQSGITCPTGSTAGGDQSAKNISDSYAQTCTANSGYKFSGTCSVTWKIKPASLTPTASCNNKDYDGNTTATCTVGVTGLVGSETVTVTKTGCTFANANAGTGKTVTCTGVAISGTASSNYSLSGTTASSTANINKIANTLTVTANTLTYNTQAQSLVTSSNAQGTVYYSKTNDLTTMTCNSTNGSTTVPSETNAGTYTVYYCTTGNTNYNATSGSKSVTISPFNINGGTIGSVSAQNYTGSAITPTPSVTVTINSSSKTLSSPSEITYSYSSNTNPTNAASVIATGTGNYTGTLSTTFTMKPRVVFNGNGSTSGTMSNQNLPYNTATALTTNAYSKTGYTFAGWNTSADGSGTSYTDGQNVTRTSNLTLYAQWTIVDIETPTISGGATQVYNYGNTTTITCSTTSTYASGTTIYYEFGYATSAANFTNGTITWGGSPSSTATKTFSKTAFRGIRYYTCRIYASDGTQTTSTKQTESTTTVARVNARIYFDATTNGGTISGTTPLYASYANANLYSSRTGTSTRTMPTATKTGYTFNGWYTASSGGIQVVDGTGAIQASVTDGTKTWTDSSGQWILTSTANNNTTNVLYAQFTANEISLENGSTSQSFSTNDISVENFVNTATNGTGTYTYEITSGNSNNYFSLSGRNLTIAANTPAGTYTLTVTATDSGSSQTATGTYTVTISKIANTLTVTANTLTYTGSAQALVTASNAQGTAYYSTTNDLTSMTCNSTNGSTTIPTEINAGTYTVYYCTTGNGNYNAKSGSVSVTIDRQGVVFPTCTSKVYTGSEQTLYEAHNSGQYTNTELKGTNVNSYTVSLTPTSNYKWNSGSNVTSARTLTCQIIKSDTTTTLSNKNKTYNGNPQPMSGASSTLNSTGNGIPNDKINFVTRQNAGQITPEDEVTIAGENFYVVSSDEETTVLLAKYDLKSDGGSSYEQDTSGAYTDIIKMTFSSSNYWYDYGLLEAYSNEANPVYTEYHNYVSPYPYVYDSNSNLYTYVNSYANKIANSIGISVIGKILTYEEANNLSTIVRSDKNNAKYWLGSLNRLINDVFCINSDGTALSYPYNAYPGIRPVLVIPTYNLYPGDYTYTYYDNISCTGAGSSTAPTNAGVYGVKATLTSTSNYNSSTSSCATYTINTRAITVKATNQSKEYDGSALNAESSCEVTSGSLPNGHTLTCTNSGSQINAGSSIKTLSEVSVMNSTNDVSINYNITSVNGTLTVSKYTPSISLNKSTGTVNYDVIAIITATPTTISACQGTLTAISENTSKVSIISGASYSNVVSGTIKPISWKGICYTTGTNINVNYLPTDTANCNSATQVQYSAKVNKLSQTVALNPKTSIYTGSAIAANTATASGGGTLSYKYYTNSSCTTGETSTAPTNVGQYYVIATAAATTCSHNSGSSECTLHTINNATITLDKGDASSIGTPTTLYTRKGATELYTGIQNTISATLPTVTCPSGYDFAGWYTENGSGSKVLNADGTLSEIAVSGYTSTTAWIVTANKTIYARCVDIVAPTASITSTDTVKSANQTLTLTCTDNVEVTGYYYGTTAPTASSTYTTTAADLTALQDGGLTKTVSSAGTYYLSCKDAAGNTNVSANTIASKQMVNYTVNNMLLKVSGTKAAYSTNNYASSSTNQYLIPNNTSKTVSSLYTIPTCNSTNQTFKGYTTSSPGTSNSTLVGTSSSANITLSSGSIITNWFDRVEYSVTVSVTSGSHVDSITVTNQNGDSKTSTSSLNDKVLALRCEEELVVTNTPASGYIHDEWLWTSSGGSQVSKGSNNPTTITDITSSGTLTASATAKPIVVTLDAVGGTIPTTSGWTNGNNDTTATKTIYFNQQYGTLPEPTKTGYTFEGWKDSNNNTITSSTTLSIPVNHTLTADWEINVYQVKYIKNLVEMSEYQASTTSNNLTYSIDNKKVTATALANNGYASTLPITAALETGKTYIFSCSIDGTWGSSGQQDAYLNLSDTNIHMTSNDNYEFTVSTSGTYTLKLYVNNNGDTRTFDRILIYEKNSDITQSFQYGSTQQLRANTFTNSTYVFAGWSTSPSDNVVAYDNGEYSGTNPSGSGNNVDIKEYTIAAPFAAGDVYQLDVDVKGTGSLSNYFHGASGYLQVSSWTASNGESGSGIDGYNAIPLSSNYTHYSVRFTLGSTGSGSVNKTLLFRLTPGNSATIKNIVLFRVSSTSEAYVDKQSVNVNEDMKLYSIWSTASYKTVTFDPNQGTVSPTSKKLTGTTYGDLPVPTRSGYSFNRWVGRNLYNKAVTSTIVEGYLNGNKITKYGSHRIVYIPCLPDTTYTVSKNRVTSNDRFGVAYTVDVPANNVTIYGQLTAPSESNNIGERLVLTITTGSTAQYLAIWVGWNSDAQVTQSRNTLQIEYGSSYTAYEAYIGPVTSSSTITASGNHTLVAEWDYASEVTVTFDPIGGSVSPTSKTVTYGEEYGSLPTPTKAGLRFVNWTGKNLYNKAVTSTIVEGYLNGNKITKYGSHRIVYIPCLPDTTYTVSKNRVKSNDRFGVAYTVDVPANNVTIYGQLTAPSESNNIGERLVLTITTGSTAKYLAVWVGWNSDNDVLQSRNSLQIEYGNTATLYDSYRLVTSSTILDRVDDHTLYASYVLSSTITYNANGGSGAPAPQSYDYSESGSINLSSTIPTKSGYTFAGWSLSSNTMTPSYSAGQSWSTSNYDPNGYTLYAVWLIYSCPDGGEFNPSTIKCEYAATVTEYSCSANGTPSGNYSGSCTCSCSSGNTCWAPQTITVSSTSDNNCNSYCQSAYPSSGWTSGSGQLSILYSCPNGGTQTFPICYSHNNDGTCASGYSNPVPYDWTCNTGHTPSSSTPICSYDPTISQ